jgi:hypothetical protein
MMVKSLKIPAEVVLGCFLQLIQKLKNLHLLLFFELTAIVSSAASASVSRSSMDYIAFVATPLYRGN